MLTNEEDIKYEQQVLRNAELLPIEDDIHYRGLIEDVSE